MKSSLAHSILAAGCLVFLLSIGASKASEPFAVVLPGELGNRWPGLVANYLDRGASIEICSKAPGMAQAVWIRTRSNDVTMRVELVVHECLERGFESSVDWSESEGWSAMPTNQRVLGISDKTWSKVAKALKDYEITVSKTTTVRRWADGKPAAAWHSCHIQLPLNQSEKLLSVLKIYFESLPDEGRLQLWER